MKKILFIISLLLIADFIYAQTGTIKGNVKDAKTNEPIIGASVVIEGTTIGNVTDLEGNFSIPKVSVGTHSIVISFVSYKTSIIDNVIVEVNKTTLVNTSLEENVAELGAVEIIATRQKSTEIAVINEIKQAEQVAVGISSQQISRSQDRDAAQVVRRVPGVSIFDDKFIIVRGLAQRYNGVMLNDALTPSSEIDTRAFSFDMIPSAAIDRMIIYKSPSPELPGDFAGGIIKVFTKNVPEKNDFNIVVNGSYRNGTTSKAFQSYEGGKYDFLGFDNGKRILPASFPDQGAINGSQNDNTITRFKQLPSYYSLKNHQSLPDLRLGIGFSKKFTLGEMRAGNITSLNYSNTRQYQSVSNYRYLSNASDTSSAFYDDRYISNVRFGALSNFVFFLNSNDRIEFRNLFNQIGIDQTSIRNGINYDNDLDLKGGFFRYESRSIYSGQLNGIHNFSDHSSFNWIAGFSYTLRNQPDYRIFSSSRNRGTSDLFQVDVAPGSNASLSQSSRFYSKLNEYSEMVSGNYEHQLNNSSIEEEQIKIRAGVYLENKQRDFSARWFGYTNPNFSDTKTSFEQFYSPSNISPSKFLLREGTNYDDQYQAGLFLAAGYISTSIPITSKINISGGIRTEYSLQRVDSRKRGSGAPSNSRTSLIRPLPSFNLSYNFTKKSLLRIAYGLTLNRPEFRELAPFNYFDADLYFGFTGNPGLKTASIQNFDLRYEFYPSESEMISIGAFGKKFNNLIEQTIRNAGSGIQFTYQNADKAISLGTELEVRKSLQNASNTKLIQNLNFVLNASLIYSQVYLDAQKFAGQDLRRPMQGQSPYLINAGLYYNDVENDFQFNLLYNVIGPRIYVVGDNSQLQTVHEMPRNVIDLSFTKGIGRHFQIRGGIQDILNQKFRFVQDTNSDSKISRNDGLFQKYGRGTYTTLGINYKF